MTREIKFRIFDLESGMSCGLNVKEIFFRYSKHDVWDSQKDFNDCWEGYKCALMQYTGIKDKNGVEIYEGDIVHTGNYEGGKVHRVQTVIRDPQCFGALVFSPATGACLCLSNQKIFEVIGNIYENPELLERSHG